LGPATAAARKRDVDRIVRLTGRAILGPAAYQALSKERLRQVYDNTFPEEFLSKSFLPRLSRNEIRNLQVAVLLVGGRHSPFVFGCLLRELQRLLPNARQISIDNASHLAHEDNPDQFNNEVLLFLQANG
jgi:pimeloyl-ACP methyl ester carboxylesterase